MRFDESFADKSRAEECPKRDKRMSANNAGQIEERIWNRCTREYAEKADAQHGLLNAHF